jgi:hypothetical protein
MEGSLGAEIKVLTIDSLHLASLSVAVISSRHD